MDAININLTRREYDIIAKSRGNQKPQDMSTEELLNTLSRYDARRKVKSIHRKLWRVGREKVAKIQNISINELNKAENIQKKSIDELKAIARLRRIENFEKLSKEVLILTLLKSESNALENNNFNNNNTNDDDEEIQ